MPHMKAPGMQDEEQKVLQRCVWEPQRIQGLDGIKIDQVNLWICRMSAEPVFLNRLNLFCSPLFVKAMIIEKIKLYMVV